MSDLTPVTRNEAFLAAMNGQDVTLPEPQTRNEKFMKAILDNSGNNAVENCTRLVEQAEDAAKRAEDAAETVDIKAIHISGDDYMINL